LRIGRLALIGFQSIFVSGAVGGAGGMKREAP
jgi:hypothetical protein